MKQTKLYLHKGVNQSGITFTSSDGTTPKIVFAATTEDSDLKFLSASHNDEDVVAVRFYASNGATNYNITTTNIAAGAGTDGITPAADLLTESFCPAVQLDAVDKPYFQVMSGNSVKVAPVVAMATGKTLTVFASGNDY